MTKIQPLRRSATKRTEPRVTCVGSFHPTLRCCGTVGSARMRKERRVCPRAMVRARKVMKYTLQACWHQCAVRPKARKSNHMRPDYDSRGHISNERLVFLRRTFRVTASFHEQNLRVSWLVSLLLYFRKPECAGIAQFSYPSAKFGAGSYN